MPHIIMYVLGKNSVWLFPDVFLSEPANMGRNNHLAPSPFALSFLCVDEWVGGGRLVKEEEEHKINNYSRTVSKDH